MDPIPGLQWGVRLLESSPRDQQIQRILGAQKANGDYKFFLQQGDRFYVRTVAASALSPPPWSTQSLPSHRNFSPSQIFSDGDRLFFVNDSAKLGPADDPREECVYQAIEGDAAWQQSAGLPQGIVAVAGGPGYAYAATKSALYRWDGASWSLLSHSFVNQEIISISLDLEGASPTLVLLLRMRNYDKPYAVKLLPGLTGEGTMLDMGMTFDAFHLPRTALKGVAIQTMAEVYQFWGLSINTSYVLYGSSNFGRFSGSEAFEHAFEGLQKHLGRFYAYRSSTSGKVDVYHLRDDISPTWQMIEPKTKTGSVLSVKLEGENSFATDGLAIYLAGSEGLFRYPLNRTAPNEAVPKPYVQNSVGWEQEPVELSRASVLRVYRVGGQNYVRTQFGIYRENNGQWEPFELDGRRPLLFSSIYGQVAVNAYYVGGTKYVDFYLFQGGAWQKILNPLPNGAMPKEDKVFFSKDRLYVAATTVDGKEAVFQRPLNVASSWSQAAPAQPNFEPYYISDGSNLIAIGHTKTKYASLSEQVWKDYPSALVNSDGVRTPLSSPTFNNPIAVNGYAFAWINVGGEEFRLCRMVDKGWMPIASNLFSGGKVETNLSTDGHYFYSTLTEGNITRDVVRLPIRGDSGWELMNATVGGVPLREAALKVNGPPLIDRETAMVYLPTTQGLLGP